jgi:hypothetical protein
MIYRPLNIDQSNSSHVHARAGWYFSVYQSIHVHIIYLCCEYQIIWSYNEWFIDLLILANQIQAHAHARTHGQFWPHRSIKCLDFYLWHKYQANLMKNNEVIVHWNFPKYNIFARAHVHARSGRLFWPCSSVGDLSIYLPFSLSHISYFETTACMYSYTIKIVHYLEPRFENISIRLPKDNFVEVTGPYIRQCRV